MSKPPSWRLALPGMASHLQSTIANTFTDSRPERSGDGVNEVRRTRFLQGRRASLVGAVLNLINAIIGSGVLGLPYIMANCGSVLFLSLLVCTAITIDYSLQLLIASAVITGQPGQRFSYELLGEQAFGLKGRVVVSIMIMLQNTGNMVSYFKVFKDVITGIMENFTDNSVFTNDMFMTTLVAYIFVLPVSCSSRIGFLAYVGILQVTCVVGFVAYVFAVALHFKTEIRHDDSSSSDGGGFDLFNPTMETFLAMPTFCFSYICHTALLPVYDELQEADDLGRTKRPRKRMITAIHIAIGAATAMYAVVSISGYALFGTKVKQDLLVNFDNSKFDPGNHIVRVLFLFVVLLSIPLQCFPFRKAFTSITDVWLGNYVPMTWLAKDIFSLQDYKILSPAERAEQIGMDISRCDCSTLEFMEYVLGEPNLYKYDVPEGVDAIVVGQTLGRYIKWVRHGQMMLTCVPKEEEESTEMDEATCPTPFGGWEAHLLKTFGAVTVTVTLALFVPQITVVFGVAGSTCSVWLELILPAAIFIKLSLNRANLSDVRKYGSLLDEGIGEYGEQDAGDDLVTEDFHEEISPLARILPMVLLGMGFFIFAVSWGGMIYSWVA